LESTSSIQLVQPNLFPCLASIRRSHSFNSPAALIRQQTVGYRN
jgi:hypothetical protein